MTWTSCWPSSGRWSPRGSSATPTATAKGSASRGWSPGRSASRSFRYTHFRRTHSASASNERKGKRIIGRNRFEIDKENFPNNFKGKSFRFARSVHLLILIRLKRCIIEKGDAVSIFYSQIKQVLYGGEDT